MLNNIKNEITTLYNKKWDQTIDIENIIVRKENLTPNKNSRFNSKIRSKKAPMFKAAEPTF